MSKLNTLILFTTSLKILVAPGFEQDHFLTGLLQPSDIPDLDQVPKSSVTVTRQAHYWAEYMLHTILTHELQDVELVFRSFPTLSCEVGTRTTVSDWSSRLSRDQSFVNGYY